MESFNKLFAMSDSEVRMSMSVEAQNCLSNPVNNIPSASVLSNMLLEEYASEEKQPQVPGTPKRSDECFVEKKSPEKAPIPKDTVAIPKQNSFPWKLYDMLTDAEENGFESIVSWELDGMAFKVHNHDLFLETVMPLYFDQTKYESFRRQLNLYGFSRVVRGRFRGTYHHKYFMKSNRHLCKYIIRSMNGAVNDRSEDDSLA